jgi:hypothetical protein
VSEIYNFFFSIRRLLIAAELERPKWSGIAKPVLCAACATVIPLAIMRTAAPNALQSSSVWLAVTIACGGIFYFAALYLIGSLQARDIKSLRRLTRD